MASYEIEYSRYDKMKGLVIPKTITPELAYLCGIIAGDGSINYRAKKCEYSVECAGNSEDEIEYYKTIILPLFTKVFGFVPKLGYYSKGSTFGFRIYNKSLFMYLTKFIGLPHGQKDSKLGIPKYFLNDKALLLAFIRGVFDTDGCVTFKKKYKYPTIVLGSASPDFIREISNVLKNEGFTFYEVYDYKRYDPRFKEGFSLISRIEINGKNNFEKYMNIVGFSSSKHLDKIKKNYNIMA